VIFISKTFFVADLHFGHKNCLSFDNRPYTDIETHDNDIISKWNKAVGIDDTVWILGDISWYGTTKTVEIFNQLNGTKNLCIGNHDYKLLRNREVRELFTEIVNYKEIRLPDGKGIVLSHYPIPCFNKHYYGWYHLYGHVHNSYEWHMMEHIKKQMEDLYSTPCNMYNVGVMISYMEYSPKTLKEIITTKGE
jgi:calcineurin-like phosphoesterase family protein